MQGQLKLSYHARKLLALKPGVLLHCQTSPGEEVKDPQSFWIDPPGRMVGPSGARELIAKGCVIPCGDGLFDGFDQSWQLPS